MVSVLGVFGRALRGKLGGDRGARVVSAKLKRKTSTKGVSQQVRDYKSSSSVLGLTS